MSANTHRTNEYDGDRQNSRENLACSSLNWTPKLVAYLQRAPLSDGKSPIGVTHISATVIAFFSHFAMFCMQTTYSETSTLLPPPPTPAPITSSIHVAGLYISRATNRSRDALKMFDKILALVTERTKEYNLTTALHEKERVKHFKDRARGLMNGAYNSSTRLSDFFESLSLQTWQRAHPNQTSARRKRESTDLQPSQLQWIPASSLRSSAR